MPIYILLGKVRMLLEADNESLSKKLVWGGVEWIDWIPL